MVRTWWIRESVRSSEGAVSVVISARSMSLGIPERIFWSSILRVGEFICLTRSGFLPDISLKRDMKLRSKESCPAESKAYSLVTLSGEKSLVSFLLEVSVIVFPFSSI